ncbi:hypothetical protein ACEPAI_7089 [Sanghuangporus weigelae]
MALVLHPWTNPCLGSGATSENESSYPYSSKETLDKVSALVDNNGRPVILLKIYRTPQTPASIPIFYENEEITGNVELNLTKPESVEEVVLSIRGIMKGLAGNAKVFIEVTEQLWDAHQVDQGVCSEPQTGEAHRVQLKGYFNWPFSLKLPYHVQSKDANPGGLTDSQQLPPSFSMPNSHSSISYEVNITVRGRHNLSLSSSFQYVPAMRPPCLASPVGLACNQAMDEDQWEVFRSFPVRGIAFATYSVDVVCTFALPKPLHYIRGASVLCALAIESSDENVLELLGNSRAPFVRLTRHVEDSGSGLETKIAKIWDAIKQPSAFVSCATWRVADVDNEQNQEIKAAIRALQTSLGGDTRSKIVVGQICLAPDLTPSFSFAKMTLKYEIQILPFRAAGFVAEDGERAIFFRTGIKIASAPPMPTLTRPSSIASTSSVSRANSMRRHQPNASLELLPRPRPAPASSATYPLSRSTGDPSNPACRRRCNRAIVDRDRPLPSVPKCASTANSNLNSDSTSSSNFGSDCDSRCIHPPERKSSLRDERPGSNPDRDSEEETRSAVYSLRRSATAPQTRGPPLPPRASFPSRQCTR